MNILAYWSSEMMGMIMIIGCVVGAIWRFKETK